METGLPGIILLVGFLLWWARQTASVWRRSTADRFAQAATIASAVILMHSLVDYPLRTATMSAIFAACLALMAQPRLRDPEQARDLWPTRHLTA
jgi:O-antigen ligase